MSKALGHFLVSVTWPILEYTAQREIEGVSPTVPGEPLGFVI